MMFDDYNYDHYNKFILHDNPQNSNIPSDDIQQYRLTLKYLKEMHTDKYSHDQLDVMSDQEKKQSLIEKQIEIEKQNFIEEK